MRTLRLVRLVCRRWASTSTEHLFEQIYFASRPESIRRFEYIIQNPHLAECVKHLVFDDAQLPKRLLWQVAHAASAGDRIWSHSEQVAAHDAFCQHYRHQEEIRATSKDFTVLLEGLSRLSRLKKMSIIGGPSHLCWLRIPPGPHSGDLVDTGIAASYWSYHKEDKAYYEPWGSHRVQRLFEALSSAAECLTALHIGNWQTYPRPLKMGLPLSSLTAPDILNQAKLTMHVQNMFSHLSELNLQIDLNPRVKGDVYSERYFEPLFQILSSTTRLKRLAFGVTQWKIAFDVHHTQRLLSNTWPALTELKLRCLRVDPDTLLNFFARHKETLTTLFLQHVGFEPNTSHTWLDVAQQGGEMLHLDYAELDVYEWGDGSDISYWQDNSTATDLGVILGGGYAATPPSCDSDDGGIASAGGEAKLSAKAGQVPQGFGRRKEICDRCGRWFK